MKKNYKEKIISFFKESPDQVIIIAILVFIIFGAIYASYQFYLALYPEPVTLSELDYREIKLGIRENVLNELDRRQLLDLESQKRIEKIKDPFE